MARTPNPAVARQPRAVAGMAQGSVPGHAGSADHEGRTPAGLALECKTYGQDSSALATVNATGCPVSAAPGFGSCEQTFQFDS